MKEGRKEGKKEGRKERRKERIKKEVFVSDLKNIMDSFVYMHKTKGGAIHIIYIYIFIYKCIYIVIDMNIYPSCKASPHSAGQRL